MEITFEIKEQSGQSFCKIILFEKNLNCTIKIIKVSNNEIEQDKDWWYKEGDKTYTVKILNSFEEISKEIGGYERIVKNYKPSDYFVVSAGQDKEGLILKKDCIKIK